MTSSGTMTADDAISVVKQHWCSGTGNCLCYHKC